MLPRGEWEQISAAARRTAVRQWSWEGIARSILDLMEAACTRLSCAARPVRGPPRAVRARCAPRPAARTRPGDPGGSCQHGLSVGALPPAGPFLTACAGTRPTVTPVWFMRQAGRALPEYRRLREGIGMLDACRRPDLVTEITLQPVRRLGTDAAILFSDIVVPLAAAGVDLDIVAGHRPGDRRADPVAGRPRPAACAGPRRGRLRRRGRPDAGDANWGRFR